MRQDVSKGDKERKEETEGGLPSSWSGGEGGRLKLKGLCSGGMWCVRFRQTAWPGYASVLYQRSTNVGWWVAR